MSETDEWKRKAFELWRLLDNIDTLDDACRSNDEQFRNSARLQQRKRFDVVDGPGFDALYLEFTPPSIPTEKDTR
jgi:hypothetical protein